MDGFGLMDGFSLVDGFVLVDGFGLVVGCGIGDGFGVHAWCLGPAQDRGDHVPDRNLPALLLQQTKKHMSGLKF